MVSTTRLPRSQYSSGHSAHTESGLPRDTSYGVSDGVGGVGTVRVLGRGVVDVDGPGTQVRCTSVGRDFREKPGAPGPVQTE